jgi:hypothetical protein
VWQRRTRESTQLGGARAANGRARARRRGGAKLPGRERRENFEKDPTLMGATRAALRRRGREQAEERGPRAGERLVVELDGDGEGGGRRRWEGAPASVAGDGATRERQVARSAAAGRDHRQGPQELRAHAQPAARHQVTHPRAPPAFRFFSCHARC